MRHEDAIRIVLLGQKSPANRPAHPAGHPITWGAITDGTILSGSPYPFPVFVEVAASAP